MLWIASIVAPHGKPTDYIKLQRNSLYIKHVWRHSIIRHHSWSQTSHHCMLCRGMAWHGLTQRTWKGVAWQGRTLHDTILNVTRRQERHDTTRHAMARRETVRHDTDRHGSTLHDTARHGMPHPLCFIWSKVAARMRYMPSPYQSTIIWKWTHDISAPCRVAVLQSWEPLIWVVGLKFWVDAINNYLDRLEHCRLMHAVYIYAPEQHSTNLHHIMPCVTYHILRDMWRPVWHITPCMPHAWHITPCVTYHSLRDMWRPVWHISHPEYKHTYITVWYVLPIS